MAGRKITIRFPEDHPVWSYPAGKRSTVLREQVDINIMHKKVNECLQRVTAMEAKLDKILDKIESVKMPEGKPDNRDSSSTIDPEDVAKQVLGFLDEF